MNNGPRVSVPVAALLLPCEVAEHPGEAAVGVSGGLWQPAHGAGLPRKGGGGGC